MPRKEEPNTNRQTNDKSTHSSSSAYSFAKGATQNETSQEDRVHPRGREGEGIKQQKSKTDNVRPGPKQEFANEYGYGLNEGTMTSYNNKNTTSRDYSSTNTAKDQEFASESYYNQNERNRTSNSNRTNTTSKDYSSTNARRDQEFANESYYNQTERNKTSPNLNRFTTSKDYSSTNTKRDQEFGSESYFKQNERNRTSDNQNRMNTTSKTYSSSNVEFGCEHDPNPEEGNRKMKSNYDKDDPYYNVT